MTAFKRAQFDLLAGQSPTTAKQDVSNLSELVAFNAKHNASHTFCLQGVKGSQPFRLTFADLERAVQACSAWLLEALDLGRIAESANASRPGVALFMDSDVSIFIYIAAIVRCNLKCVLLSARLAEAGVQRLIHETNVQLVLASPRLESIAQQASVPVNGSVHINGGSRSQIQVRTALDYSNFLLPAALPKLDPARDRKQAELVAQWAPSHTEQVIYLHSSGSTGLPKPIGLANTYLLGYAACHEFSDSVDESTTGVVATTLPLFHGFGLLPPCLSLSIGKSCFFPPASVVPGGPLVASMIKDAQVTALMTVPSILEDVIALQNLDWAHMRKLEFVAVGGGAMKLATGTFLKEKGVNVLNHFGATELGALAPIFRPGEGYNWKYLRLRQDMGLVLSDVGTGSHGQRLVKLSGQPFGWTIPFELQDRMELNPASKRPELRLLGRTDDLIVLANGEKVSPNAFEQGIVESPLVATAVLFGDNEFQLGLLVEPSPSARRSLGVESLREQLWEIVATQNASADSHAQISSANAILLAPSDKVIPRSDKGSFQRKAVYAAFEKEITAFYQTLEQDSEEVKSLDLQGQDLVADVSKLASSCIRGLNGSIMSLQDRDLMELGMDSLGLAQFRRLLQAYVKNSKMTAMNSAAINNEFIYSNPSVASVANALVGGRPSSESSSEASMEAFVKQYSTQICRNLSSEAGPKAEVLLTGATGSLGAQIVNALTKISKVGSVTCLLRQRASEGSRASAWQSIYGPSHLHRALMSQHISLSAEQWSKVRTLYWKPGQEHLGLGFEEYSLLSGKTTHIIHAAWPMNFSMKLSSYAPHIKACVDLLELAKASHEKNRKHLVPRMVFISSISTVGSSSSIPARETLPASTDILPMGYAEAKWACESILAKAADCLAGRVQVTTARVGQIAGAETTMHWNESEHIARVIKASKAIGSLPKLPGTASWLPADRAAGVIIDLLFTQVPLEPFYNVENPVRQAWSGLLQAFKYKSSLVKLGELEYEQWLPKARPHLEGLEAFFEDHFVRMATGSVVLDTANTRRASRTLATSGAVSLETVMKYVKAWEKSGLLK